jgi:radical SAM superfamily enzyme with C-terminal helix-hairpin-helix motif
MDAEDFLARAARELVASLPPPTPEQVDKLTRKLRLIAAKRKATNPDVVARYERERKLRQEMRRVCEQYLAGEVRLQTLTRRLRGLERELSADG